MHNYHTMYRERKAYRYNRPYKILRQIYWQKDGSEQKETDRQAQSG